MQILKFRAFSSKQRQGFVILKKGTLPDLILEDILFQLFEELFPSIFCPEIYFFSSTDEILKSEDLTKIKDYIYVHFLERIEKYKRNNLLSQKLKICSISQMSTGISFEGTNLYIFSQKQYMMYQKEIFRNILHQKIDELSFKEERKVLKYNEYLKELEELKDNFQMIQLKNQIKDIVDQFQQKVQNLETMNSRFLKIKATLTSILKNSGINLQTIKDLH